MTNLTKDDAKRGAEGMPFALKRFPIIRHVRYFVNLYLVNRHYARWGQVGALPVYAEHDYAILDQIWRGEC